GEKGGNSNNAARIIKEFDVFQTIGERHDVSSTPRSPINVLPISGDESPERITPVYIFAVNCDSRFPRQFYDRLSRKWETQKAEVTLSRVGPVISERKASSPDTGLHDRLIRPDIAIHSGSRV
ncbi:hypothetical protein K0M31_010214, partial [Melipona bicolor]